MSARITITETGESSTLDVIRVDYSPEAVVTEHPVELGAEVGDHVQIRPLRMTVEVFVTASPRGAAAPFAVEDAIGFLERALGQLLLVVIDGEGTFSSMVLEAAPHSRTALAGRSFSLRLKHVRIAASLSVAIPPRAPAPVAAAGGPTEQPLGQQATEAGTPSSKLFDLGQSVNGLVKSVIP
jgi:hypothetical protein